MLFYFIVSFFLTPLLFTSSLDDDIHISLSHEHPLTGLLDENSSQPNPPIYGSRKISPLLKDKTPTSLTFLFQGDFYPSFFKNIFPQDLLFNQLIVSLESQDNSPVVYQGLLDPDFYHVTEVSITGLQPQTNYTLRMGYARTQTKLHPDFDFSQSHTLSLCTPASYSHISSLIIFSCCKEGRLGPLPLGKKAVKRAWKAIEDNIHQAKEMGLQTDAILSLGDTVYPDFPLPVTSRRQFIRSYHRLFHHKPFKRITQSIPFKGIGDDHAVENDSSSREIYIASSNPWIRARREKRFDNGLFALRLLELPHDQQESLWRHETIGQQPIFFADMRRERTPDRIMDDVQYEALKDFIQHHQETLPLVAFSVPFSTQDGHGSCTDYPVWQRDFMEFLTKRHLKCLIISGDTHVGYAHLVSSLNNSYDKVGPPLFEATISGLHACTRSKASSTHSYVNRLEEGGVLFHADPSDHTTVMDEDLFARLTINHALHTVNLEYFNTRHVKINHITVDYSQDIPVLTLKKI